MQTLSTDYYNELGYKTVAFDNGHDYQSLAAVATM
jgi:hypothetical protein